MTSPKDKGIYLELKLVVVGVWWILKRRGKKALHRHLQTQV